MLKPIDDPHVDLIATVSVIYLITESLWLYDLSFKSFCMIDFNLQSLCESEAPIWIEGADGNVF